MAYWVLAGHPSNYRVVDSVLEQDQETWRTGGRSLAAGDRVAIYKYKGREAARGVVALGEVLTDPEEADFPEDDPYALPGMRQRLPEARVPGVLVRYVHPPRLPLWVDERPDSVVNELSVTRAQGGTAFRITDEQWERLLQEAGGWPGGTPSAQDPVQAAVTALVRGRIGQGAGLTAAERRAVEERAVEVAMQHFRDRGWTVLDVSANSPYDLRCTRGEEECRVEVKGTTTDGDTVLLTKNEVVAARADPLRAALVLVRRIRLAAGPGQAPLASGGELRALEPWKPAADDLDPLVYRYRVPPA